MWVITDLCFWFPGEDVLNVIHPCRCVCCGLVISKLLSFPCVSRLWFCLLAAGDPPPVCDAWPHVDNLPPTEYWSLSDKHHQHKSHGAVFTQTASYCKKKEKKKTLLKLSADYHERPWGHVIEVWHLSYFHLDIPGSLAVNCIAPFSHL